MFHDLKTSNIIENVSAKLIEVSPIESAIPAIGDSELNATTVPEPNGNHIYEPLIDKVPYSQNLPFQGLSAT